MQGKANEKVSSAGKAAKILMLLGEEPYIYGVTEIGQKISCGKSGTHKLLMSLLESGLIALTPEHRYTLGPSTYMLGKCYSENVGFAQMAIPYLVHLRDLTGENATFSILSNGKPTVVWREYSNSVLRIVNDIGEERAFYAGAIGKVLTAYEKDDVIRKKIEQTPLVAYTKNTLTTEEAIMQELAMTRERGYAISDSEYREEMCGIAVPVRDYSGKVWAALSLGIPQIRLDEEKKERYVAILKNMAKEMEESYRKK